MTRILSALLLLACAPAAAQGFPPDTAVARLLEARVAAGRNPGIVAGLLDAGGRRYVARGTTGREGVALDGDTPFEIGSITKVFTGVLLASLVATGDVALEDPVARHLPDGVAVPSWEGREITLLHLATHTSGLPRLPSNLGARTMADPYAEYGEARLYAFLAEHSLRRAPGEGWEYSNLGAGLLGHALAYRAGTGYEAVLRARVLAPLGMDATTIGSAPERDARTAQGHNALGEPVPYWNLAALAGAGALRSTAADLLAFAAANLAPEGDAPLGVVLAAARVPRAEVGPGRRMGLGWVIQEHAGATFLWHNGGTGGFRSFLALDLTAGRAVVVLSNGAGSIDDIGLHLLDSAAFPLPPAAVP